MTKRDSASIRIELLRVNAHEFLISQCNNSKSLIHLPQRNIILRQPCSFENFLDSLGWRCWEFNRRPFSVSKSNNSSYWRNSFFFGFFARHEHHSSSAIIEFGGIGSSNSAAIFKDGPESRDLLGVEILIFLIHVYNFGFSPSLDLNWDNFLCKAPIFCCGRASSVRCQCVLVLIFAADVMLLSGILSTNTHVNIVVSICETICQEQILDHLMTISRTGSCRTHNVGDV
mmetsp:Transcript_15779/g.22030  ORF Transcript_15779/g.22030 Transcript_15779/m.22030 type:complete len:229 (-) Transcript_15779:470-1156(-)